MTEKTVTPTVTTTPASTPADPAGPAPRVIDPGYRLPLGSKLRRFKVRCDAPTPGPIKYVLAKSREQAEAEYNRVREASAEAAAESHMVTVELAD